MMRYLSPAIFAVADMLPTWIIIAAATVVWRLRHRVGRRWIEAVVVAASALFVLLSTPHLRFSSALHGDEPRYLTYCENWFLGRGVEVSAATPVAPQQPPRVLNNLRLMRRVVAHEATNAAREIVDSLRTFSMPANRAAYVPDWYVRGKDGGIYQVHTPGYSLLLFPGYFADRMLARARPWNGRFPDSLLFTNALALAMWAAWIWLVFRGVAAFSPDVGLSAALTLVFAATVPPGAMPFQLYPEIAAGVIVLIAASAARRESANLSRWRLVAAGALIGYLPWLHVRFLALSFVLAAWMLWTLRREWGAAVMTALACVCLEAAFVGYVYHVSGSLNPTALYYAADAPEAFHSGSALAGFFGILLDRRYGLLPIAPIFFVAAIGAWPAARRHGATLAFSLAAILALMIPAAGHGWEIGGTPLRHVVAVLPLLMLPVSCGTETVIRRGSAAAAVLLLVAAVTIHNGLAYNLHHTKDVGRMIDASISGWKPALWFPSIAVDPTDPSPLPLTLVWTATLVGLVVLGAVFTERPSRSRLEMRPRGVAIGVGAAVVVFSLAGAVSVALGRPAFEVDYIAARLPAAPRAVDLSAVECDKAPGAPADLTVTWNSDHTVVVTWTASSGSIAEYIVESGSAPGLSNFPDRETADVALGTVTFYRVPAGTYYARVKAKNRCGVSPPSNEVSVTVK